MSTLNGSTYRKTVSRSVYSDSLLPERRRNGFPTTPQPPMTYLEPPAPLPRAPSRSRTPTGSEVAAVDPTLEDAQKAGNNYHITMSLNAALADAGLPASVAMATGRRSQMEYSTNSRAQSDYGTTNSLPRMSRLGFAPQMAPPPSRAQERPGSVSVVRVTGNDDVRLTGSEVVGHAHFSFPVTQARDGLQAVNEAYTIRSVQPSEVTQREETLTTVERPKSRVGFDLELFGGQTTVVTETTSTASRDRNHARNHDQYQEQKHERNHDQYQERKHERNHERSHDRNPERDDERDNGGGGGNVARLPKAARSGGSGRDGGGAIAGLPKAARPAGSGGGTGGGGGPSPKPAPRSISKGENRSSWVTTEETVNEKRARPDNRQMWNPGESTRNISQDHVTEMRLHRPTGIGSTLRGGDRSDGHGAMSGSGGYGTMAGSGGYGEMAGSGDGVDGYEYVEYETVHPWLINGMGGDGGGTEDESIIIYRSLAKGADASTVRQEVMRGERETEIVRPKDGRIQQDLINVDIVSENVTVIVGNNVAQMTIKVRTELIVPIDESKELFQKSSVTITRLIEVDMMATPERQRIYDQVLQSQRDRGRTLLSQKQTFDLYKAFLMLTETGPDDSMHEQLRIDKETDQSRMTHLDLQRELQMDSSSDVPVSVPYRGSASTTGYRQRTSYNN